MASTGPFIELSDAAGRGPGDTTSVAADGSIALTLRVWAPSWMPIDEVRLLAGGRSIEQHEVAAEPAAQPDPARAVWFERSVTLQPTTDAWYAVEASGSTDLEPVYPGSRPWALTAPLFVDVDGDGVVTLGP